MKTATTFGFICTLIVLLLFGNVQAQDSTKKEKKVRSSNDTVIVLKEVEKVVIKSLMKGRWTIGIGGQLKTDFDKNFDEVSTYFLDMRDQNFFLRLTSSYFIKDRKSVGAFIKHSRDNLDYSYVTLIGDTVNNETKDRAWGTGVFYKMHQPVFGSKRVYWISTAELGIKQNKREDITTLPLQENISKNTSLNIGAVLRFGFLVFPFNGMSIEGSIGALGVGYESQKFTLNDEPNGTSNDFILLFTPDIMSIQFRITTYF